MEKEQLIQEVLVRLPEDFKTKFIVFKNTVMPFPTFLETEFINYFPDNAELSYIIDVVYNNFKNRIKDLDTFKIRKVEKFAEENVSLEDQEEFKSEALARINDNLFFNIGEKEVDIDEFYKIFVNNHQVETYSEEEIKEMLDLYLSAYLEEEYHDYVLSNYGMTAKQYVYEFVLTHLDDKGELTIDLGTEVSDNKIEQAVIMLAEYTREIIKSDIAKQIDDANHVSENPSLVPEITSEIPVIVPPLTEDEIASLTEEINEEELLYDLIADIREYIYHCNSQGMIEWVNMELTSLENLVKDRENNDNYQMYLVYAFNKLEEIKQNVIKVESNKGDYIDAIFGQISFSKEATDVIKMNDEVDKKNINDKQLKEKIAKIKRDVAKRNISSDFKKLNKERFFIEAEIEYRIIEIRRLKKELEAENASNNYIAGTGIKYDLAIKEFEKFINEAPISEEDRSSYINIINSIINENKNGIGRGN